MSVLLTTAATRAMATTTTTVRYVGEMTTVSEKCATSAGGTSFEFTVTNGPSGVSKCAFVAYDAVLGAENAKANATAKLLLWEQEEDNAEVFQANFAVSDPEGTAAAKARNQTAYETYAEAETLNATAHEALEAAILNATTASATASVSGGAGTYDCSVPSGDGGLLVVLASADVSGGVLETTWPNSTIHLRRTKLEDYQPKAGPSTGGTVITFTGDGFNDDVGKLMKCSIMNGNYAVEQTATHLPDGSVTCETPSGAQTISIQLVYPDSCSETATFLYYQNPSSTFVTPSTVPRYGASNFTVYMNNAQAARLYAAGGSDPLAGILNTTCAIGMGGTASQTAPAAGIFPAVLSANNQSLTCMIPDGAITAGTYDVRVSYNGQQYLLSPFYSSNLAKVSITIAGPTILTKHYYDASQNVREDVRLVKVPVELVGDNRKLVSVDVQVTYGGVSPMPGTSGDSALVQVNHKEAKDNTTSDTGDYDFTISPTTLHWMAGDNGENFIYVRIRNDRVHEEVFEALTLTLVNAKYADIAAGFENHSAIVNVEDDDPPPVFEVSRRNVVYPPLYRNSTERVNIPIDIVGGGKFAIPAVVDYATIVSSSTFVAVRDVHYSSPNGRVTWTPEDYNVQKSAQVTLHWERIPLQADLRLSVNLTAVSASRVNIVSSSYDELNDASLFIFGVPQGSCPPGSRRTNPSAYTAPPPLGPAPHPHPPAPPPPTAALDAAILRLSVVVNTTAALGSVFHFIPDGIALSPAFDSDTRAYTATVPYTATGVQIYYQFRQSTTQVATTYSARRRRLLAASAVQMSYFSLQTGNNFLRLITTSPNGQASETYRFTINRLAFVQSPPAPSPPPPAPSPPPSPPPWTKPPPPPPEGPYTAPPAPPAPPAPRQIPTAPADDPACTSCPAGTFSSEMNALACLPCHPGTEAPEIRSKACAPCAPGHYMSASGAERCLKCPLDTFAATSGSTLCTLCESGRTTRSEGGVECGVTADPVLKEHPDVFYVEVRFGVSFHQAGSTLANFTQNVGINANVDDAFVRAMQIDLAMRFNVTKAVIKLSIVSAGEVASSPTRRRALLAGMTVECSASDDCIRAAAIRVTMQATEIVRYGVVREYETTVAAIDSTKSRATEILRAARDDPVGFFSKTILGIGGAVTARAYEDPEGGIIVEKEPEPPRTVPDVFGRTNVALITILAVLSLITATMAYTMRKRWHAKKAIAKIDDEIMEAEKRNFGTKTPRKHISEPSYDEDEEDEEDAPKVSWKRAMEASQGRDIERALPKKQIIQMREQSQHALAAVSSFRKKRAQTAVQAMWQAREDRITSRGIGTQRPRRP